MNLCTKGGKVLQSSGWGGLGAPLLHRTHPFRPELRALTALKGLQILGFLELRVLDPGFLGFVGWSLRRGHVWGLG